MWNFYFKTETETEKARKRWSDWTEETEVPSNPLLNLPFKATPTLSVSGPWMDHILHLVCIWGWYFLAPHTHVLCMGSGSATAWVFPAPRLDLVHSLLKFFFLFQLWYWIQLYTTKYSNLILMFIQILVWIFGSTYRKGEILKQKWHTCQQSIVSLLHEIHIGLE